MKLILIHEVAVLIYNPSSWAEFGHKIKKTKQKKTVFAIVIIPICLLLFADVSDNYQIEKFISESEIMLHLDHPNILNLMGMCFNMADNLPAIVLPYMDNGDLRKFLLTKRGQMCDSDEKFPKVGQKKKDFPIKHCISSIFCSHILFQGLDQPILLGMCMDIARGMHYLAKCKLVHRDLAARNCM